VIAVPRLPRTLSGEAPPVGEIWGDTAVVLPPNGAGVSAYRDVLTDRTVRPEPRDGGAVIALAGVLAVLPVAVLEPV
jgi:maltooligosyltrehalose synthase